jgi:hypothetical protein
VPKPLAFANKHASTVCVLDAGDAKCVAGC